MPYGSYARPCLIAHVLRAGGMGLIAASAALRRQLRAMVCGLLLAAWSLAPQALTIYTDETGDLNFQDAANRPSGCAVEVVRELQRRLHDTSEIRLVPWARGYTAAVGTGEAMLFSTARNAEREALFKWVGPIYRARWSLYGRAGQARIADLDAARRLKSIGVVRADAMAVHLTNSNFDNLEEVTAGELNVGKLLAGRIDAMVGTNLGIADAAHRIGRDERELVELLPLREVDLYLAFSRATDDAVVQRWSQALAEMKRDGSFKRIYRRWYPRENANF